MVLRKPSDKRIDLDHYFMEIAKVVAKRSTCLRNNVGAVLVKDKHIISTGYNGAPSGLPHCSETGCLREQLGVPSGERHELCRGALHGVSTEGATMYCTHSPCSVCAKMIINAKIKKVVYLGKYNDERGLGYLREANVELVQLDS